MFPCIDLISIMNPWPDNGATGEPLAQILPEDCLMSKPDLSSDIAAFLARGGAIQTVAAGEMTGAVQAAYAANRAHESGRFSVALHYTAYSMNRAEGANHADAVNFAINSASKGV